MTDQLPPETARRFLDLRREVEANGPWTHAGPMANAFNAITDEDIAALEALCPEEPQGTVTIKDDSVTSLAGFVAAHVLVDFLQDAHPDNGTYDHYERAGWVKREAKPVAPPKYGPWVKLAVVGERPDGVEFGAGESADIKCEDGSHGEFYWPNPLAWATATHYRRERIRCVSIRDDNGRWRSPFGPSTMPPSEPGVYCLRGTLWTKATTPEVTAAKAGRDPNGVIAWHGGGAPEGRGIAHYRDGDTRAVKRFNYHLSDWTCTNSPLDIIAYEVAE